MCGSGNGGGNNNTHNQPDTQRRHVVGAATEVLRGTQSFPSAQRVVVRLQKKEVLDGERMTDVVRVKERGNPPSLV